MRFTTEQLSFLARFAKSPDGREVVNILNATLAEVEIGLRTKTGEDVYRQQGRAVQLDELITLINKANERLNQTLSAKSQTPRQDL